MSTSELPEDPSDWPTDPFTLLGVTLGGAEMDIKRAYGRLIRRFKPEHFPEQFRRIREAYERCLFQNQWFTSSPEKEESGEPSPAVVDVGRLDRSERRVEESERLWALAIEGKEAEAYAGLVAEARRHPERADDPLRLYWLLYLKPELDSVHTHHHWLGEALKRARLLGSAAELYRRELEANPQIAISDAYPRLLAAEAPIPNLFSVARQRLAAAGRLGRYDVIAADLEILRGRISHEDESSWLAFLVSVHEWTTWQRPDAIDRILKPELERLHHLQLSHIYYFDRLEEIQRFATMCREEVFQELPVGESNPFAEMCREESFHALPAGLLFAIHLERAGYDGPIAALAGAVAAITGDPQGYLRRFDRIAQNNGMELIQIATRLLERHFRKQFDSEPEFPSELVRGLFRGVDLGGSVDNYFTIRFVILRFLKAESLDPLELAAACDEDPEYRFRVFADHLRADTCMRLVWLAIRLHQG